MWPGGHIEHRESYVRFVLDVYLGLPETPARSNRRDRLCAEQWFAAGVPRERAETALILASLRRLGRPMERKLLGRIRSLAYFQPVVEELEQEPLSPGYAGYLRGKWQQWNRQKDS